MLGEYALLQEIGCGSFGKLYRAEWKGKNVALKTVLFSLKKERKDNLKPMLELEYDVLQTMKGEPGFPEPYECRELAECNILSMQLLSKSLEVP